MPAKKHATFRLWNEALSAISEPLGTEGDLPLSAWTLGKVGLPIAFFLVGP